MTPPNLHHAKPHFATSLQPRRCSRTAARWLFRQLLKCGADYFAYTRILLLRCVAQQRPLFSRNSNRDLPVRFPRRLESSEVKLIQGQPHDFTRTAERMAALRFLNFRDERNRQIEGERRGGF